MFMIPEGTIISGVIGGFISKIINDSVDESKSVIKKEIENKTKSNWNFQAQIYQVMVNVLNQITYNRYENDQDRIYQVAENILKGYKKFRCDNIEVVRSGLQVLGICVNNDKYMEFKALLYQELGKDDYKKLYREVRLLQQNEESEKTVRIEHGVNELKKEIKEVKRIVLDETKKDKEKSLIIQNIKIENDKKRDYIKIWNSRLFLHIDNDDNPISLAEAYIMPNYEMLKSIKRIGFFDDDSFDQIIDKFIKHDRTSTMLITGVPGIGKSTITSWIANKYKDDERVIILRFRDWKRKELEEGLLNAICHKLSCENESLENRILILDGFDEMKTLNIREKLLNDFINDIKDFENFKCIITSRTTYISSQKLDNNIELCPFDYRQIGLFYKKITKRKLNGRIDDNNIDVFGIPVILYMAIMSDIDITKNITKPKLYNRIFAEKDGIFDRFSHEGVAYSEGAHIFRDSRNT